jgi:predicted membrane chloride channel (bestrophin family)
MIAWLITFILFIVMVSASIFGIVNEINKKLTLYISAFFIVVSVIIYFVFKYYFAESDSCGLVLFWPLNFSIFGIGLCMFLMFLINLAYQRIVSETK